MMGNKDKFNGLESEVFSRRSRRVVMLRHGEARLAKRTYKKRARRAATVATAKASAEPPS